MEVTDVSLRINGNGDPRLLAFASVESDRTFVVHEVRLIRTGDGQVLLAFPSRRMLERCPECPTRNVDGARYCNGCGVRLADAPPELRRHRDAAHPVCPHLRDAVTAAVHAAYAKEMARPRVGGQAHA